MIYLLKPYFIHYDTTLLFTGGLGSGKSLNSVKFALKCYKKSVFKWRLYNLKGRIKYALSKHEKGVKYTKTIKPVFYSNIPVIVKKFLFKKDKILSTPINKNIFELVSAIPQFSVIFIDEFPLFINQYQYNNLSVQTRVNEFIALFRHYVGGYLVLNAQSESEIVKQVRTKLNSYFWCYDFQKFLCFYRVRILHLQTTDYSVAMSSQFIEDSTKWSYGLITKRYNTRAYKHRYDNIPLDSSSPFVSSDLTTNAIITYNMEVK